MAITTAEVHDLFRSEFDERCRVTLVQNAASAQSTAFRLARELFAEHTRRGVIPALRRAEFEGRLASVVAPGVTSEVKLNSKRTSTYVELQTDGSRLTALGRSRAPTEIKKALYRETLATGTQMCLFDEPGPTGEHLYGLFVYGGGSRELKLARVYFPIPGLPLLTVPPLDLLGEASIQDAAQDAAEKARPTERTERLALQLRGKASG